MPPLPPPLPGRRDAAPWCALRPSRCNLTHIMVSSKRRPAGREPRGTACTTVAVLLLSAVVAVWWCLPWRVVVDAGAASQPAKPAQLHRDNICIMKGGLRCFAASLASKAGMSCPLLPASARSASPCHWSTLIRRVYGHVARSPAARQPGPAPRGSTTTSTPPLTAHHHTAWLTFRFPPRSAPAAIPPP